ncbi:hypothetical protein [uncultured Thiocystis sp.]|jgi:hypothetical protein|uniref:hypothetical protein n=1 Tax=uncultured Thiocystis sp. TaxID=1202134 RepID=UPI0025D509A8|nr:hypothetical protein [uncultured Thiocystis sp.]
MTIGIKEAVKSAREQALQLFEEETLNHLALEEVEFDEATQHWLVTLGYDSPHKLKRKTTGPSLFPTIEEEMQREYKVFRLDSNDCHLISMSIRSL